MARVVDVVILTYGSMLMLQRVSLHSASPIWTNYGTGPRGSVAQSALCLLNTMRRLPTPLLLDEAPTQKYEPGVRPIQQDSNRKLFSYKNQFLYNTITIGTNTA
eukprot:scaffold1522_cov166-Amphora_coffeaeformis.AAC.31